MEVTDLGQVELKNIERPIRVRIGSVADRATTIREARAIFD